APDSREHESLVVTTVKPSAIHAGMLAAGLEPGQPLRIEQERRIAPTGDAVRVEVATVLDDVPGPFNLLSDWVIRVEPDAQTSAPERLSSAPGWGLVFAGSRVDGRGYAADNTGTIVGLTGFGTEVIGASWTLSPWAAEDEPVWIVDAERIADYGTEVIVRISTGADNSRRADDPADPAGPSVVDDPDAARPRPER
ncbi:MAG: YdjY domain-containing protein, partial [Planctomycetota bacterium]